MAYLWGPTHSVKGDGPHLGFQDPDKDSDGADTSEGCWRGRQGDSGVMGATQRGHGATSPPSVQVPLLSGPSWPCLACVPG